SPLDRVAEEPQAGNVGFRIHAAPVVTTRRDRAVPALPGTQRVDAKPGHLRDDADRIARRVGGSCAHRANIRTTTAAAADASAPHAVSASVSTNGHCRSVE